MTRDWGSWSGSRFSETTQFRHPQHVEAEVVPSALPVQTIDIPGIPYATLGKCQLTRWVDLFACCRGAVQTEAYPPREAEPETNALALLCIHLSNS